MAYSLTYTGAQINDLLGQVTTNSESITTINTTLATLTAAVDTLNDQVATASSSIGNLSEGLVALNSIDGFTATLSLNITTLSESVDINTSAIAAISATITAIPDMRTDITSLQANMSGIYFDSQPTTISDDNLKLIYGTIGDKKRVVLNVTKLPFVANLTQAPTADDFNGLLNNLQAAGLMATNSDAE